MVYFGDFFFWKPEACGQTELPDKSILIGQKMVENAKIEKLKGDIFEDFQTLCYLSLFHFFEAPLFSLQKTTQCLKMFW